MKRGIFIAGTDTSVGKTLVAGAIAASMVDRGSWPGVLKPVESGCAVINSKPSPVDGIFLKRCAGRLESDDLIVPYAFEEQLAPGVAAAHMGIKVSLAKIADCYNQLAGTSDSVIVEGAGGLMVPFSHEALFPDLIADLGLSVLIVADNRLGCVNHTLLTLKALDDFGLRTIGVLLNNVTPEKSSAKATNRAVIDQFFGRQIVLAELPYVPELAVEKNQISVSNLTSWFSSAIDVEEFLYLTGLIG